MSAVRIVFDELAQRWEFSRPARAASSDLVEERADVFVGRDGGGHVVEVVVDVDGVVVPTGAALETVVGAFGEGIGAVLDGLDLSIGVDTIVDIAPRSALEVPRGSVVPGEPGVLIARTDGGFDVPVGDEVAHVEVTDTGIEVRLADRGREGLWVRVSDNESGTLLALGPLRRTGTARRASITFGLTVGPDDTVFSVTDDPLDPVAPRPQRRRDWVDELLERASHERFTRPLRALHHAHEARRVADAIDDGGRRRRAESSVRRSRLTIGAGAGALLVLVALGALAWWVVGGGDDDTTQADPVAATVVSPPVVSPSVVAPSVTAADLTTVPPVASVPDPAPTEAGQPNGGPSEYQLGDAAAVVVALDGSTSVRAGDTVLLLATGSITVPDAASGRGRARWNRAMPKRSSPSGVSVGHRCPGVELDVPAAARHRDPGALASRRNEGDDRCGHGRVVGAHPLHVGRHRVVPRRRDDCRWQLPSELGRHQRGRTGGRDPARRPRSRALDRRPVDHRGRRHERDPDRDRHRGLNDCRVPPLSDGRPASQPGELA